MFHGISLRGAISPSKTELGGAILVVVISGEAFSNDIGGHNSFLQRKESGLKAAGVAVKNAAKRSQYRDFDLSRMLGQT